MSSLEQALKSRIRYLSQERDVSPAQIWQNIIVERFLVRLFHSSYRDYFVLKGGFLLMKSLDFDRETRDLDFSVQSLSNDVHVLEATLSQVVEINLQDGFTFTNVELIPLDHSHMQYPGVQAKLQITFGKSRHYLFIDLAFGDVVNTCEKEFHLLSSAKGPLFESSIQLKCYPMEFVFAEKLETIVYRGVGNSRMKDFHDLYILISTPNILDKQKVLQTLQLVFNHRGTVFHLPLHFDSIESLQAYWNHYRKTTRRVLPDHINEIINTINQWLIG